jgi:hypothetical protein
VWALAVRRHLPHANHHAEPHGVGSGACVAVVVNQRQPLLCNSIKIMSTPCCAISPISSALAATRKSTAECRRSGLASLASPSARDTLPKNRVGVWIVHQEEIGRTDPRWGMNFSPESRLRHAPRLSSPVIRFR